jgi:SAM-dependent methyltransferase
MQGQEVHAADPTLIDAAAYGGWKKRALQFLGITSLWGLPLRPKAAGIPVRYVPDSMQNLRYDDGFFDRVFCLSVMEHIPDREWPECMRELSRVLSEEGRLALTLSMSAANANVRQYEKLLVEPSLRLVGNVDYVVPIGAGDKQARHPGHTLEILGLIWDKK